MWRAARAVLADVGLSCVSSRQSHSGQEIPPDLAWLALESEGSEQLQGPGELGLKLLGGAEGLGVQQAPQM